MRLYGHAEALPTRDLRDRASLRLDHGLALFDIGQGAEARACAEDALRLATEAGDSRSAARARLLRLDVSLSDGSLLTFDPAIAAELEAARADAEASGDPGALAEAWQSMSARSWSETRLHDSEAELKTALGHARAAGDTRRELEIELNLLVGTFAGPSPAGEVVAAARELAERAASSYPTVRAEAQEILAVSEAMLGRFDEAFGQIEESIAILGDLAQFGSLVNARTFLAWAHRLAGDLPSAEAVLRQALAEAIEIGDRSLETFVSCRLAEVLVNEGRFDEAETPLAVAERDPVGATETRIVGARARIRAARGDRAAEADVDTLLAMVADGPWLNVRTEAYIDAAHAMAALGSRSLAETYATEALRLCHAKGDVALATRTQALVDRIVT